MKAPKNKGSRNEFVKTWKQKMLLRPENPLRILWEIILAVFLLILALMLPYTSAFQPSNEEISRSIDIISLVVFSIDIVFNFNTAFYKEGEIVINRTSIAKNYLKRWFLVDFITSIPFDIIIDSWTTQITVKQDFTLFTIKNFTLLKLIRLSRLKVLFLRIEDQISNEKFLPVVAIFKLLLYLFFIAHFLACIIFSISLSDLSPNTIIYQMTCKSEELLLTSIDLYITSVYWAIVTMTSIGYGDISPQTTNERIFGVIAMLISSVMFGVIVGNIGTLSEKYSMKETERRNMLFNANLFIKTHNLSTEIKHKLRRYIEYAFNNDKFNESKVGVIISSLSQPLQEEIFLCTNGNAVRKCVAFRIFTEPYINRISKQMQVKIFLPMDHMITEGQVSEGMYFIVQGYAEVYDLSTSRKIIVLSRKQYFGEIGLFTRQPCASSVMSTDFTETLFLSFVEFEKIVESLPAVKEKIIEIQRSCTEANFTILDVHCYSCRRLGHIAKHCQAFLGDEIIKQRWLEKHRKAKGVNVYDTIKENKRRIRKVDSWRFSAKNVLGRERRGKEMYGNDKSLLKGIKHYFQNNIVDSVSGNVLQTEESAMNTMTFQNIDRFGWILDSLEDEEGKYFDDM